MTEHKYLRARQALEHLAGVMAVVDWTDPDHMAFDGPLLDKIVNEGLSDCGCFTCSTAVPSAGVAPHGGTRSCERNDVHEAHEYDCIPTHLNRMMSWTCPGLRIVKGDGRGRLDAPEAKVYPVEEIMASDGPATGKTPAVHGPGRDAVGPAKESGSEAPASPAPSLPDVSEERCPHSPARKGGRHDYNPYCIHCGEPRPSTPSASAEPDWRLIASQMDDALSRCLTNLPFKASDTIDAASKAREAFRDATVSMVKARDSQSGDADG